MASGHGVHVGIGHSLGSTVGQLGHWISGQLGHETGASGVSCVSEESNGECCKY